MSMEWTADWIWLRNRTRNSYAEFRMEMVLDAAVPQASLHVSACQSYMLYINGHLAGRGPSPCDPNWQYYDSYDAAGYLVPGVNTIAAVCYYFGETDIVIDQMQGEAGFILQLNAGERVLLASGADWSCRLSRRWVSTTDRISRWGGFKEIFLRNTRTGGKSPRSALQIGSSRRFSPKRRIPPARGPDCFQGKFPSCIRNGYCRIAWCAQSPTSARCKASPPC